MSKVGFLEKIRCRLAKWMSFAWMKVVLTDVVFGWDFEIFKISLISQTIPPVVL